MTSCALCRLATNSVDDRELNVYVAMDSLLVMEDLGAGPKVDMVFRPR